METGSSPRHLRLRGTDRGELDTKCGDLVGGKEREQAFGRAEEADDLTGEHQRIVRGHSAEMLVDAFLRFEGQLAQAIANLFGDR